MPELAIILKVESYVGKDTFLEVGGDHIKEHVGGSDANMLSSDGVMYAIIHVNQQGKATSEFGYATEREARETVKKTYPKAKIITC